MDTAKRLSSKLIVKKTFQESGTQTVKDPLIKQLQKEYETKSHALRNELIEKTNKLQGNLWLEKLHLLYTMFTFYCIDLNNKNKLLEDKVNWLLREQRKHLNTVKDQQE